MIRFGFATDTYDSDGEAQGPVQTVNVSLEQLRELASAFRRIRSSRCRLRFRPRRSRECRPTNWPASTRKLPLKPVQVEIKEFEILGVDGDQASFRARVASGTYMRSVAHDMGQQMGCGAHLQSLRRTRLGEFDLSQAHTLEELDAAARPATAKKSSFIRASCCRSFPASPPTKKPRRYSQRPRGKFAGAFPSPAGEGFRRAKGTDRHRHPDRRDAVPSQDRAGR